MDREDREEELLKATQEMFRRTLEKIEEALKKNPQDTYLLKRKEALEKALGRIEEKRTAGKRIAPPVLKVNNNLMTHSQGMLLNNARTKEEKLQLDEYIDIEKDYLRGVLRLRQESERNKYIIEMPLEGLETQRGAGMIKIFEFLLHKATTMPPQNPTFEFPFSEFRELVGLKNKHIQEIKEDLMQLSKTHISVEKLFGEIGKDGKPYARLLSGGGLFNFAIIEKPYRTTIKITVSPFLFEVRGFTYLPAFAWSLKKPNAFSLITYIASILAFDGANNGFKQDFEISFKPIAKYLGLPIEDKKNFDKLVAKPLLEAIGEINNHPENHHIYLEPVYQNKWKILEGNLKIHLRDGYLQHFKKETMTTPQKDQKQL